MNHNIDVIYYNIHFSNNSVKPQFSTQQNFTRDLNNTEVNFRGYAALL